MRGIAAAAAIGLSGCALLLHEEEPFPRPPVKHVDTAYQIEGEVRDESTLAPMPDALVTIETDRPGYLVTRRADAGGRYAIGYSVLYRVPIFIDRWFGDDTDAVVVSRVSIRAEAKGRCSPIHTFRVHDMPRTQFLLLLGDCDLYQPHRQ